jgi:formate hydrogenlyase subunit 6/NADH:ubiquinone oxidoreductase subunit I
MNAIRGIAGYFRNIYESVTTIATGMWITFKTAFFERKVTIQYPSHDPLSGRNRDEDLQDRCRFPAPFEWLLGASQRRYRGPLASTVSVRYRGLLGHDESKCISCLLCARTCPIDVITVKGVRIEGRKGRAPITYVVDYAKCMFCGLCVEACPTGAVFFTRQFEAATYDYHTLIRDLISPELRHERLELAAAESGEKAADHKGNM